MTPRVISLDIETYGACERDAHGNPLPDQTCFSPRKSVLLDRCPPSSLILCVSITVPEYDPRCTQSSTASPSSPSPSCEPSTSSGSTSPNPPSGSDSVSSRGWNGALLAALRPSKTFVLLPHITAHRRLLRRWLNHVDTIIGMNIPFDILYLRSQLDFREPLSPSHTTLIDNAVARFSYSEYMPERSLKDMGPVLSLFAYEEEATLRDGRRFPNPTHTSKDGNSLLTYCAQDSHNTLLALAEFARRIPTLYGDYGPSNTKLSEYALAHYSDLAWASIRATESGIPMSRPALQSIQTQALAQASLDVASLASMGLKVEGVGSQAPKLEFLTQVFSEVDATGSVYDTLGVETILAHPLFQLTKEKHDISLKEVNRKLASVLLPPSHPMQEKLKLWHRISHNQGLVSKFTMSLLSRKRAKSNKNPFSSILLPQPTFRLAIPAHPTSTSSDSPSSSPSSPSNSASPSSASCEPTLFDNSSASPTPSNAPTGTAPGRKKPSRRKLGTKVAPPPHPISQAILTATDPTRNKDVWLAHPKWFYVPSPFKDSAGGDGGQRQARESATDPCPQQWPAHIKTTLRSRWIGGSIIEDDANQAELRSATMLSGDRAMLRAFNEGLDLHSLRAASVFSKSLEGRFPSELIEDWCHDRNKKHSLYKSFSDEFRQPCKHANFTMLNLGGADVLQRTILDKSNLLIPLRTCQEIVDRLPLDFPELHAWQQATIAEADRLGYLIMPITGHSHMFSGGLGSNKPNEMVNFKIQASAALCVQAVRNYMLSQLPMSTQDAPILYFNTVYDGLYFDVRPGYETECQQRLDDAYHYVNTSGYWARMCEHTGHHLLMKHDTKVHRSTP